MAPINLYDTTIPTLITYLQNLSHVLKKAETWANEKGIAHSELIEARLAPDMKALPFQVQIAARTSSVVLTELAGVAGLTLENNEKTFDDLQALIAKAIHALQAVKREDFADKENKQIAYRNFEYTGLSFVNTFALPNFFFHVVTAYDILRSKGVDLGKADYLGEVKK